MPKQLRDFEVYLVHVDSDKCDGCEKCVKLCPGARRKQRLSGSNSFCLDEKQIFC